MAVPTYIDRYVSTVASSYTSGGTTLSVTAAPSGVSGACNFFLIIQAEGANTEEVVVVTNISGTTFTIAGAQAGTSASNHGAGAVIIGSIFTKAAMLAQGLVLLAAQTASSSSSLNFTSVITSDFDEYEIHYQNLIPGTSGAVMQLLLSTDGGSTYSATGYVNMANFTQVSSGPGRDSSNTTSIGLSGQMNTSSAHGCSGYCNLFAPGNSAVNKQFIALYVFFSDSSLLTQVLNSGEWQTTTAVNAFQIKPSSGNIASGIVRVYGRSK